MSKTCMKMFGELINRLIWIFCEAMRDNSRALNINSDYWYRYIYIEFMVLHRSLYVHGTSTSCMCLSTYRACPMYWVSSHLISGDTHSHKNLFTQINFDMLKKTIFNRNHWNMLQSAMRRRTYGNPAWTFKIYRQHVCSLAYDSEYSFFFLCMIVGCWDLKEILFFRCRECFHCILLCHDPKIDELKTCFRSTLINVRFLPNHAICDCFGAWTEWLRHFLLIFRVTVPDCRWNGNLNFFYKKFNVRYSNS